MFLLKILQTRQSYHLGYRSIGEQLNSHNPSQDNPPEPELINQFVPGYESYQRRVGQMIMRQHRQVFG